jgi:hypothetical protein
MSYPYPKDRSREKRTKGDQPYEDDREAYAEKEARLERMAPMVHNRPDHHTTDEEQDQDAEERFEQIGEEVADLQGRSTGEGDES